MADDKALYDLLSMLDRLEELREDLVERELNGLVDDDTSTADTDLAEAMAALGLQTLADVDRRIAELNAQVDLLELEEIAEEEA